MNRTIRSLFLCSFSLVVWHVLTGSSARAETSIAPSRVLVVYNANWGDGDSDGVGDSLQVANYYASKRGVPAANLLGLNINLNFGPIRYDVTEYTRFYGEMIQPIRSKLAALGPANIDVILLCYGVPYNLGSTTSGTGFVAIDNVLMALNSWSPTTNDVRMLTNPYIATNPTFELDRPAFSHNAYKIAGKDMYLVARLDGMSALRAQNLVDQALYAERYLASGPGLFNGNVYVDSRNGGYTDASLAASAAVISGSYNTYDSADANIAYASHYLAGTGLPLKWENTSGSLSIGQPGTQYTDGTSALAAPRALMYGGWYNAAQYFDVYEWLPGSIACDLNSVSFASMREGAGWAAAALARGASAVSGVLGEPYLSGHQRPNVLLYYMLKGYTFAEASTLSSHNVGWMAINIGDPLYTPFKPKAFIADTNAPALAPGYPRVSTVADPTSRLVHVQLDDAIAPETARILVDYGPTAAYGATADFGQGFYRSVVITLSGLQTGGFYHYRVRMIDPVGNTTTSGDFTFSTGGVPPPVDAAPSVALTQPGSGTSVSGAVTLAAVASDDKGVARVEFLVDGAVLASVASAPFVANWASSAVANGGHTIVARAVDTAGNASLSNAASITVVNGGSNSQSGGDEIWVGDAPPAGATLASDGGDGWSWTSSNPQPYSGTAGHQSALVAGVHQHYFYNASTAMPVATGDTLVAYVYLDPTSPPSEIMLQWNDGAWNSRAYWGANSIDWGVDGTRSRRYMGPLPSAGQWVRLEVPASLVGLEGATINGMAFTLAGGRATWDHAGKGGAAVSAPPPQGNDVIWVGDAPPVGSTLGFDGGDGWFWTANNPLPYSGTASHQSTVAAGVHQHYFSNASTTMTVAAGDSLVAYVYLDPSSPPSEIMLQWNDGAWNSRAYWGANAIDWGVDGTRSRRYMGPLPAAGQWVRLEVPASMVGLEGATISGMAFTLFSGRATWDHAGKSTGTTVTAPPPTGNDVIWVSDAPPAGATLGFDGGDGWSWTGSNPLPYSGTASHQSALAAGAHQHYFYNASTTMTVAAGESLVAYVYLDPSSPPSEIMLQWNDGNWNSRAYWGSNSIDWGVNGTRSRQYMGPLPPAGQWIRLEVPAYLVGLEGATINGMAFTLFGGRATWDHAGKSTPTGRTP